MTRTDAELIAIPKSAPPKPEPPSSISLEAHQQELADACEEARRTTAERCAEIAGETAISLTGVNGWGYSGASLARIAIEEEFGLKESK